MSNVEISEDDRQRGVWAVLAPCRSLVDAVLDAVVPIIVDRAVAEVTDQRDRARDTAVALEQELAQAEKRHRELRAAVTFLRTWTNEDGKFVLVDDLLSALRADES